MSTSHRVASQLKTTNLSKQGLTQLLLSYKSKNADAAIVPGFKFKQGFVYSVVRAISARVNQNFDGWPSEELKKSYKTFLGKPVFVNHANDDPTLARGRVVAARYIDAGNDKYIEVIQETDGERFPKLAKVLIGGDLDSVSMGVEAKLTICSYCQNKAVNEEDFCDHVLHHKGEYLPRTAANGETEQVLVYESCRDLHFFELSYVFDPADETAVVSKVLTANKKRAFGEIEAPAQVDTLRKDEVSVDDDDFYSYVDPPKEFQDPDLDEALQLDRDELGENVVIEPTQLDDNELADTLEALEQEVHARGLDDGSEDEFHQDEFEQGVNPDELEAPAEDELERLFEESQDDDSDDEPIAHLSRRNSKSSLRNTSRHNRTNEGTTGRHFVAVEDDGYPDGDVVPVSDDSVDEFLGDNPDEDQDFQDDSAVDAESLSDDELIDTLDDLAEEAVDRGLITDSEPVEDFPLEDDFEFPVASRNARSRNMAGNSLASRGRVAARGKQRHHVRKKAEGPYTDGGPFGRNDQGEQEPAFISQTPPEEAVEDAQGGPISNTEQNLVAKMNREKNQMLQTARQLQQLQQKRQGKRRVSNWNRENDPYVTNPALGGVDEGEVFVTPESVSEDFKAYLNDLDEYGEGVDTDTDHVTNFVEQYPYADQIGEEEDQALWSALDNWRPRLSSRDKLIVIAKHHPNQQIRKRAVAILKNAAAKEKRARLISIAKSHPDPKIRRQAQQILKKSADSAAEAEKVDPPMSGTDADVYGPEESFDRVELDNVETQPKDASKQAFAAFDKWLKQTTGKTASSYTNLRQLRFHAQKWSKTAKVPVTALFPTLETVLRTAAVQRKRAEDTSLAVAAPDGRVDVEAPVANDTDAEAQASQFDIGDFGNNAGDGVADPDLSTDDQIWAPGEKKSSRNFEAAGPILAAQCADALVKCGFEDEGEKYNLMSRFAKMSRPMVSMQLRLLERTAEALQEKDQLIQNIRASRGSSRGATALPPGIGSATMQRSASMTRIAENDPKNDAAMWM